ncbi:MAG TPA: hypothetical protein VFW89_01320 [Gemmatimonadaceae bacterium]|nr:hypothetical protein [Gemmatimonadaceae bacterium]
MMPTAAIALLFAQTSAAGGWLGVLLSVAIVVLTILLLVLVVVLVPTVLSLRKTMQESQKVIGLLARETGPIAQRVSRVADNMEYITTAVRADVHHLSRTLQDATARLGDAIDASELHVREFGALAGFAQEEAERAVVSAAAALRGVRAGAAAFTSGPRDGPASARTGSNHEDGETAPAGRPRIRRRSGRDAG